MDPERILWLLAAGVIVKEKVFVPGVVRSKRLKIHNSTLFPHEVQSLWEVEGIYTRLSVPSLLPLHTRTHAHAQII